MPHSKSNTFRHPQPIKISDQTLARTRLNRYLMRPAFLGGNMPPNKKHGRIFTTTIGEFVEAVYDCAMEEYMDEIMARRIAMQMLLRKLRQERHLGTEPSYKPPKKAYLRSELNRMRGKKS